MSMEMVHLLQVENIFANISKYIAIPVARIVGIQSMENYQTREMVKRERRNKTLVNACGTLAAKTAIVMIDKVVYTSPLTIEEIKRNIYKEILVLKGEALHKTDRIRVYDIPKDELAIEEETA